MRPPAGTGAGGQRGSVFLDAVVAAAIIAAAAGLLAGIIVDGQGRTRAAETRRMALLVAQSRLAAIGAEIPLAPGVGSGRDGDYGWSARITPYRPGGGTSQAGALMAVEVAVGRMGETSHRVVLRSLRLVPPG